MMGDAMGQSVAMVGCGRMGQGIAQTLQNNGFRVVAHDVNPDTRDDLVARGIHWESSLRGAIAGVEVVCTSLPGPIEVASSYQAMADLIKGDMVCIDFSTVDIATSLQAAELVESRGGSFIACPLGGGPTQAADGALSLFPSVSEEQGPWTGLLNCLGAVTPMDSIASAVGFKLICNMVGMTHVAILSEAVNLGRALGMDLDQLGVALHAAGAGSHQLAIRWPNLVQGDYRTRFPVSLALKDLGLAVRESEVRGLDAPVAAATTARLAAALQAGFGDSDVTAMSRWTPESDATTHR